MRFRNRKLFAAVFLLVFSLQTFYPAAVFALTSGPAQPEMQKFTPAGTSDMVDLFSGDFKENIPLLDVGGYPINLSYRSGTNMEEEASWVGMGWSLNPGTVNRTMRGLPDDFNGKETIQKTYFKKPFKKAGGRILVKPTFWGFELMNPPSFSLDVYKDNYYGFGASFGAALSFNIAQNSSTPMTAGLDFSSDSRDGLTISPSYGLSKSMDDDGNDKSTTTLSGSLAYNTRTGLKSWSLNASFDVKSGDAGGEAKTREDVGSTDIGSYTHYFGQSYTPSLSSNSKSNSYTLSADVGPYFFGGYVGLGGAGYVYNEGNDDAITSAPAFGYLHYLEGRGNTDALLDFNREKDGVYLPSAPSIGLPVATQDMFSVTGQTGSGQFRPYCGGDYVVFDKKYSNVSASYGAKVTVGGGWIWQLGGRLDYTHASATTQKWNKYNNYLPVGEFTPDNTNPLDEPVYMKQVGEPVAADKDYMAKIDNVETDAVRVHTPGANTASADPAFRTATNDNLGISSQLKRMCRDKRNFNFSYLTADKAARYGLTPNLPSYQGSAITDYPYKNKDGVGTDPISLPRQGGAFNDHNDNHISEVTVTDNEGKRMVYGIPVYNHRQEEYSFAISPPHDPSTGYDSHASGNATYAEAANRTGLITYTANDINTASPQGYNGNGRDGLVQKQVTPGYATSFLLTGVLSPDYVDVTGNGISDDDLGTAYKLNYGKFSDDYRWRAPYGTVTTDQYNQPYYQANYNPGLLSDPKDDQANIVYGEKELWYLRSVESKTMIAIFITSNREDGLGVIDQNGGKNTNARVLKLDAINLYSKADWAVNGFNATPIKTVHFEYDYSLYPQVPNNTGNAVDKNGTALSSATDPANVNLNKGKLTLKKIYFTFGASTRGTTNPYLFEYDTRLINPSVPNLAVPTGNYLAEASDLYAERQGDRWGTYKQSWYNNPIPGNTAGNLNNSEYPYSLQKNSPPAGVSATDWSDVIDRFASKWQLNKITTPSGSTINVVYESDDYAYVQNRQAMQMYPVKGMEDNGNSPSGIVQSQYVVVDLPSPLVSSDKLTEFNNRYLDGTNTIYFKFKTNMKGHVSSADIAAGTFNDYVSGYAEIDPAKCIVSGDGKTVKLWLNKISDYSPIAKTAWQKVKTELPQYAYNGYDNSTMSGSDLSIVMEAIYWTFVNFREIWHSFDKIASNSGLADQFDAAHSFVRFKSPSVSLQFSDGKRTFSKTGGGSRVRKIEILDNWNDMAGGDTKSATYGQEYAYVTNDNRGNEISSGVASYEPQSGNEENPFHLPVKYTEKVYWGIDKYHAIEQPYCESYFPAPGVGYSKVKVTSYGDGNARETGYIVNEFYTAKDFPTLVDVLPLSNPSRQFILPLLFYSLSEYTQATSQGFKIELNDMHGKAKSVHVVDNAGREISSTEYFYRVPDQNAESKQLNNDGVPVLRKNGTIDANGATMATDIDLVTDMRQSVNKNVGASVGIYPGGFVIPLPFAPIYIQTFGLIPYVTMNNKSYFSTATVKVVSRYGILTKVKTVKNGSSITAENTLWDPETGEVLLTKTQNEFNDYTYSFNYPAYMAYEGMGSAYKNIGAVFNNFSTSSNGIIGITSPEKYLFPGDELINTSGSVKGWVIISSDGTYRLIDKAGAFITTSGVYYLLRSGRRNLLNASAGTVVCMKDPTEGGRLSLDVSKLILDAKAVVYNEKWAMPKYCDCPPGYHPSGDGNCVMDAAPGNDGQCQTACAGDYEPDAYTSQGTLIYSSYNLDGTGTVAYYLNHSDGIHLSIDNFLWREDCSAYTQSGLPISPSWAAGPFMDAYSFARHATADTVIPATSSSSSLVSPSSTAGPCAQSPVGREGACGPLTRTCIWVCAGTPDGFNRLPVNSNVLFEKQITVPETKTYYVGLAGDNSVQFSIDGNSPILNITDPYNFQIWHIYPITLTQGVHTVTFGGQNSGGPAAVGCEIYNNTAAELSSATGFTTAARPATNPAPVGGLVYLLFSSRDMIGETARVDNLTCTTGYTLTGTSTGYTCRQSIPLVNYINPYFADILGNWHPDTSYVYTVSRVQKPGLASQNGGTNIRRSGYYNTFTPFWQFEPTGSLNNNAALDNRWVWSNTSIYYDQKGNEIENVDALGRYGSALFGYNQSLATAVAANARHNEIAFDGFEDYNFSLAPADALVCQPLRHLDFGLTYQGSTWTVGNNTISNEKAHSGNWSFKLQSTVTVIKSLGSSAPTFPFLGYDNTGHYQLLSNELAAGFAPVSGKKYLLSLWVNEGDDNAPVNTVKNLTINVNGSPITLSSTTVPLVEGWKRIEVPFTATGNFQLDLVVPGATVYVDDIRIFPYDGQMGSYVYDPVTLRLVAQLDENNFATFYEYDEEGTPIRIKKETERGIMTLKENRQSFIKHQ